MTTETIRFRSMKAATALVAERGLADGTFTITKLATAKYELVVTLPTSQDIIARENLTAGDVIAAALLAVAEKTTKKPQKINRHWNDDGSLTLYINGAKFRRLGGDENEDASEEEIEDPEAFAARVLGRRFPKAGGGWIWGRTTQGHNWHTKRQKALRARIAELEAAGADVTEAKAELAKIGG